MSEERVGRDLGELLGAAYGEAAECPPPEVFHRAAAGDLSPAELRVLKLHAAACPACRAEGDLARLFELPRSEWGELREGAEALAAELEARRAGAVPGPRTEEREPGARLLRFPALAGRVRPLWALASAAVLVLAIGALLQRARLAPPPLPAPPTATVMRGGELEAIAPRGDVAGPPAELAWRGEEGAASYRVALAGVDETPLWGADTAQTRLELPAEVAEGLAERSVYLWRVEALGEDGRRIAATGWERFRIVTVEE